MRELEQLDRELLLQIQWEGFQSMLSQVLKTNDFYRGRLREVGIERPEDIKTFEQYQQLPFTTKSQLSVDQASHPPYGTNLTFPRERYIRVHQTSGTTGNSLRWLDTEESWNWWARCWSSVYRAAGVTPMDSIFFAFSFGPFVGFWSAHEGARHIGALSIPGGGMTSVQRLRAICFNNISVLVCTPTYALNLVEVAEREGIDIAGSDVRITIHAGEPGASLPGTKQRIETAWNARCHDHAGATEVGAWGFECQAQDGLHVNEGEFIFEVIDAATSQPANEGELVITNLGRIGMPVIRYRTGDQVRLAEAACSCGRTFRRLEGGVIGRVDDLLIVRGVNVYPSAIENIIRRFPEITEFAVDVYREQALDEMTVRFETNGDNAEALAQSLNESMRSALGLRAAVEPVPDGTLPRFELKACRFADHRAL